MRLNVLGPDDRALLGNVAADVFDGPVRADLVEEFLDDPRHHIAVATVLFAFDLGGDPRE